MTNRQVLLRRRPVGAPTVEDFEIVDQAIGEPADGEVLRRTLYLSLDPYMRGRMSDGPSYAASVGLGQVMVGGTVSEVLASRHPQFRPGDVVAGYDGWQTCAVSGGAELRRLDPSAAPVSTAIGVLGMPGFTAWHGLLSIGRPAAGETVVVSAASGAVGSVVGQLARLRGCSAVGVAGGPEKCAWVTGTLGFDECVDYKRPDFNEALAAACPSGIDVYFDNVGGAVLAAALRLVNTHARIPLCGLISQYNATAPQPGPNWGVLLVRRVLVQGFIIADHWARFGEFLDECGSLVADGRLKYREDVVEGLDQAPAAFIGLLEGRNFGKLVVRI
jgi:NADPH-dependent curcumin reductase CurA